MQTIPMYGMQMDSSDCSPEALSMCDRQPVNNSYKTLINVELAKLRALQKTFEKASSKEMITTSGALGIGIAAIALVFSVGPELFRDRLIAFHQVRPVYNILVNSCQVLHNVGLTIAAAPWIARVISYLLDELCVNLERTERNAASNKI